MALVESRPTTTRQGQGVPLVVVPVPLVLLVPYLLPLPLPVPVPLSLVLLAVVLVPLVQSVVALVHLALQATWRWWSPNQRHAVTPKRFASGRRLRRPSWPARWPRQPAQAIETKRNSPG